MRFLGLRRFSGSALDEVARYVGGDLYKAFNDLARGLQGLSFAENFNSFLFEATIPLNATLLIPNRLKTTSVLWWVVRSSQPVVFTEDPTQPFTGEVLPILNSSADISDTTATILFVRQ